MIYRSVLQLTLAATVFLAACSAEHPVSDPVLAAGPRLVPEETARMLSLGGHLIGNNATAFELALACGTSLRITARAVHDLSGPGNSSEMAMITRAAEIYEDRAIAASEGPSEHEIRATIARDSERLKHVPSEQVQLAIICLRSLG